MDRGRDRYSHERVRRLSVLGISVVALAFAVWLWLAVLHVPMPQLGLSSSADNSPSNLIGASLVGLALIALLALGWLTSTLLESHRRNADLLHELHRTREEAHSLTRALDLWQWSTDTEHRITRLRPPDTAAASSWTALPELSADAPKLWESFEFDEGRVRSLRARLDAHAPIDEIAHRPTDGGSGGASWRLRAFATFDIHGRFTGYSGTARELDGETAGIAKLLHQLPVPLMTALVASRGQVPQRVQWSNAAAEQLFGVETGGLRDMQWVDLLARLPADRCANLPRVLGSTLERMSSGAPVEAAPIRTERWQARMQFVDGPVVLGEGPAVSTGDTAALVLMLVPEEQQDAQDTGTAQDSGLAMADSEAFSYTVSHDLRAPIRVVEGFTKILKEDYGRQLDRVGNDHLDRVLGAAARMNSMIDALLALAQLSATPLVRQPINLSQLAHYIVDDLRRQSPEREVSVHIQPGMQVRGDPTLLRIALENLLGNAWKYSAKRRLAQIWFECETLEHGPTYTIRDNGAGFDMRFADRLFGVFQRLHSATDFQGTGVGLASVRRIIKRHEGDIWADSEPDRGARFHFTLPQRSR